MLVMILVLAACTLGFFVQSMRADSYRRHAEAGRWAMLSSALLMVCVFVPLL